MNIREALEYGMKILKENKIDEPLLKTRIILANILKQNKEYLIIHETEILDENEESKYKKDIEKISKKVPIQYITNKQEFMGLEFYVDENVLIPQPDTEILVEEVINICRGYKYNKNIKILDLCTGSGAIGISIVKNVKNCEMTLLDISRESLKIAEQNCINLVGADDSFLRKDNKIQIIQSDLFKNLNQQNKFDIIVSNPPYIKTDIIKTLDSEVQNEPILALDGGEDGLEIYKRIIKEAYKFLEPNGYLCLEIGYDQKEEVIKLIKDEGKYTEIYSKKDLAENDRIIICRKKES